MEGAELSARFALPPNSRKYCGAKKFRDVFAAYMRNKSAANLRALKSALSSFRAHYAYLKMIAKAGGKNPFDAKVAEALWLGNGLLRKVKGKDLRKLILGDFCGKAMLSGRRARKLAGDLPAGFLPHHSFHTLYLHSISGVVPPTVATSDKCRVSWGRVIGVENDAVVVKTQKLVRKGRKLLLLPRRKRWLLKCAGIVLLPHVRVGDAVASHWGVAVMKTTDNQAKRLEGATRRNVAAANSL
jgi:hypothetical protein